MIPTVSLSDLNIGQICLLFISRFVKHTQLGSEIQTFWRWNFKCSRLSYGPAIWILEHSKFGYIVMILNSKYKMAVILVSFQMVELTNFRFLSKFSHFVTNLFWTIWNPDMLRLDYRSPLYIKINSPDPNTGLVDVVNTSLAKSY